MDRQHTALGAIRLRRRRAHVGNELDQRLRASALRQVTRLPGWSSSGRSCLYSLMACAWLYLPTQTTLRIEAAPELFAPGIASTAYAEIRLTLSPDGNTALWFSRDRPGGPGGYDIWVSRRRDGHWTDAAPVPFNSAGRDFDPAFAADGRHVYYSSDRPGG